VNGTPTGACPHPLGLRRPDIDDRVMHIRTERRQNFHRLHPAILLETGCDNFVSVFDVPVGRQRQRLSAFSKSNLAEQCSNSPPNAEPQERRAHRQLALRHLPKQQVPRFVRQESEGSFENDPT